jgi:predicted NAD/FAD-dependent oxidoreductase
MSHTVVVVGAGIAGAVCARGLSRAGHDVIVVDKGRSPGGRMATRRDGDATFDHGAQFFTVRSGTFAEQVDEWQRDSLVHEWCRSFEDTTPDDGGHARYVATHGMNTLVKDLVKDLHIRCSTTVVAIEPRSGGGWSIDTAEAGRLDCDSVVVTSPLPQTQQLLLQSGVVLPEQIRSCTYDATLVLLAVLDKESSQLPAVGAVQNGDDVFSFIADNAIKGISQVSALTFHANPMWSALHFEEEDEHIHAQLLDAAQSWIGESRIVSSQVKKWRYATAKTAWSQPVWTNDNRSLALAGDAFHGDEVIGSKIETAYLSGYAAVTALS